MKLEVGMYYRTKIGKIGFIEDKLKLMCLQDELKKEYVKKNIDNIIKASFNIIDLIEVGDYVNGHKILEIKDNKLFACGGFFLDFEDEDIIENILTHEQFEANAYKIGE